jgi:hypothetical protein
VVDFAFLEGFAAGDRQVIGEVLTLFLEQAPAWRAGLDPANPGWRDVAHTVKGSARGVGANALGDAAGQAEQGEAADLPAAHAALDAALADIEAYLARP